VVILEAFDERWTRSRGRHVVHADSSEHVRLIARTLGISETTWAETLDRYGRSVDPRAGVVARLAALADAFRPASRSLVPPSGRAHACPACGSTAMRPFIARRSGTSDMVYGRCGECLHGRLLAGAALSSVYGRDDYYEHRGSNGVGYDDYAADRAYRETKGARLLDAVMATGKIRASAPSLLEVGSGFGFTRRAAAVRGWRTQGVDISAAAARGARRTYGFDTVTSTLGEALDRGAVPSRAWDLVLYQFVLEHVAEPEIELRHAARALAPGGLLVLVVPNMTTFEVGVFGASYRSLRPDHLHLFSLGSARHYLNAAGFSVAAHETSCSLHLLKGFLPGDEIARMYALGLGPDLTIFAERVAP
jgi:SAM-dependent methyltransferase